MQITYSFFYMQEELPKLLEYVLCLIHLAVFGIIGVICHYLSLSVIRIAFSF